MSLDEKAFVMNPRRIKGEHLAESLLSGSPVSFDPRDYQRTPLVYKGKYVWGHVDLVRSGTPVERLYEIVKYREEQQVNELPGGLVYVTKEGDDASAR